MILNDLNVSFCAIAVSFDAYELSWIRTKNERRIQKTIESYLQALFGKWATPHGKNART